MKMLHSFLLKNRAILVLLAFTLMTFAGRTEDHPILPLGSLAPDFSLPGADGKTHKLSDYASAKILVIAFTCDHCPNSQMYEGRITQMYNEYKDKGVALVAISPNDPKAIQIAELDSSDVSDTLEEMKIRVAYKHLPYPFLYDGDTEKVSHAYGPQASPHIFIFDQQRKLRYDGAFDDSYRVEFVKRHYAIDAVNALLENKEIAVKHTGAFGCSTKWSDKEPANVAFMEKLNAQTITLDKAPAATVNALRTNSDGNITLISFWSTRCATCLHQFADMQDIYRMYNDRNFDMTTVSLDSPSDETKVKEMLSTRHATTHNLLLDGPDPSVVAKAFNLEGKLSPDKPYTLLLDGDGNVLFQSDDTVDFLKLRRTILANLPSAYAGLNRYWIQ